MIRLILLVGVFLTIVSSASAFNFLSEFFNDLKFGSLDNEYITSKLNVNNLKCLQGSYSFNGSCYFVSNKKHIDASEKDIVFEYLMKAYRRKDSGSSSRIKNTPLGLAAEIASSPNEASWMSASNYCKQLNNDSTLFYYNNNPREFEFVVDLLKKLNFPDLAIREESNNNLERNGLAFNRNYFTQEQKYYIGLIYNNSNWKSVNGMNVSSEFIERYELDQVRGDEYRKCGFISLRDNGDTRIDLTNCVNDKHPYICKYILDRCYNNTSCGQNGECVNLIHKKSFECRCRIFYDGKNCEKWSNQGIQMLIAVLLVVLAFLFVLVLKVINKLKQHLIRRREKRNRILIYQNQYYEHMRFVTGSDEYDPKNRYSIQVLQKNIFKVIGHYLHKKLKLFVITTLSLLSAILIVFSITIIRSKMIETRIVRFFDKSSPETNTGPQNIKDIDKDESYDKLTTFLSWDLCKIVADDEFLEDYMLVIFSLSLTLFIYLWNSFRVQRSHKYVCKFAGVQVKKYGTSNVNYDSESEGDEPGNTRSFLDSFEARRASKKNEQSSDSSYKLCYRILDLYLGVKKRLCTMRRFVACGMDCSCGVDFPIPMNPFSKRNRFITGIIYAAYTYNILKIFEHLLLGGDQTMKTIDQAKNIFKQSLNKTMKANLSLSSLNFSSTYEDLLELGRQQERGILMDLVKQICNVFIIGLRYYPVLLCVELKRKSKLCYILCTVYVSSIFIYYLYMNTFCLLSAYTSIKDFQTTMKSSDGSASILNNNQFASFFQNLGLDGQENTRIAGGTPRLMKPAYTPGQSTPSLLRGINQTRMKRQAMFEEIDVPASSIAAISIMPYFNQRSSELVRNDTLNHEQFATLRANITSNLLNINRSVFFDNFMYEKFVFYVVLCLITYHMIVETILLFVRDIRRKKRELKKKQSCCNCCSCKRKKASENSSNGSNGGDSSDDDDDGQQEHSFYSIGKVEHELKYTSQLLKQNPNLKPISFSKYLFEKYIYQIRKDFRYSKQFINTHIIAFILLYYVTCLIIRKSKLIMSVSSNLLLMLISFIFKMNSIKDNNFMIQTKQTMSTIVESLYDNLSSYIVIACLFTTAMYVMQLFIGMRRYQKNVLNAYKGKYVDIPAPKRFANAKLVSSSLHYSGYAIGYMLWGYIILFEISLVVLIIIRFLIKFYFIAENLAKIVLPILTIFLFKRILIWYLCRYFLVRTSRKSKSGLPKVFLKNSKLYFILSHFNFFFDCFLGSFVCSMRMVKSSMAALFFMPRLDYSIFGRYLEKSDLGFISYVTFIHMEVNQTHPVKLAACELLLRTLHHNHHHHHEHEDSKSQTTKMYRNKWLVALTLARNPALKSLRKKHIYVHGLMPRVESFEKFLERKVKNIFMNEGTKKKSRSTPCLLDITGPLDDKSVDSTGNVNESGMKTSTIDYNRSGRMMRVPPPPIPRRNLKNIYNMPTADIYNQISDSSVVLTDQSTLDLNIHAINSNHVTSHSTLGSGGSSSSPSHSYFSNRSYPRNQQ